MQLEEMDLAVSTNLLSDGLCVSQYHDWSLSHSGHRVCLEKDVVAPKTEDRPSESFHV
jgi:hypothetical protein